MHLDEKAAHDLRHRDQTIVACPSSLCEEVSQPPQHLSCELGGAAPDAIYHRGGGSEIRVGRGEQQERERERGASPAYDGIRVYQQAGSWHHHVIIAVYHVHTTAAYDIRLSGYMHVM